MVGGHASVEGNTHHSSVEGWEGCYEIILRLLCIQASTTSSTGILSKMEVLKPGEVRAMPPTRGVGREQEGKRDLGAQNT